MKHIIENIKQQIADFQFESKKVIVAVSGGRDSMLLLRLLQQTNLDIIVAHVNFGLRGKESADDADFIKNYCVNHTIPIEILDLTGAYKKELGGIQEWARDRRYVYFDELKAKHHAKAIAVAHHQSDQSETILYQFLRGGGLASLRGMRTLHHGIWRPLLGLLIEEMDQLVQELNIPFREDSSNQELKYSRNKIRHEVTPILNQIVPNWSARLARRAGLLAELEEYLEQELKQHTTWFEWVNEREIFIDSKKWKEQSLPRYRLWGLLDSLGFSSAANEEIERLLTLSNGRIFRNKKWKVARERLGLRLTMNERAESITAIEWKDIADLPMYWEDWKIEKVLWSDAGKNLSKASIVLRLQSLKFPITVRAWQEGDKVQPFGMKGNKLVSRLLIQHKIEQKEKSRVMVWASGDTIYWVVGLVVSDQCRAAADEMVLFIEKRN